MIRQGRRQGRPSGRGGGACGAIFPRPQLKEGGQIQICKGIKKLSTEGRGIIVVHRGPKVIICTGPPYFTELV